MSSRFATVLAQVIALGIASSALVGCGEYHGVSDSAADSSPEAEVTGIDDLTCDSNERVSGVFDYATDSGGEQSPEAAVQSLAATTRLVRRDARRRPRQSSGSCDRTGRRTRGWV